MKKNSFLTGVLLLICTVIYLALSTIQVPVTAESDPAARTDQIDDMRQLPVSHDHRPPDIKRQDSIRSKWFSALVSRNQMLEQLDHSEYTIAATNNNLVELKNGFRSQPYP